VKQDGTAAAYTYDAATGRVHVSGTLNVGVGAATVVRVTFLAQADLDLDGDVDLADFAMFQGCFNGPNRAPKQAACDDADFDKDADVDLLDFSAFQGCFNGPNRVPKCG